MKKNTISQIVIGILLGIYTLMCFLPLLLIIIISFSSDESLRLYGYTFFPREWSLKAYEYVASYGIQLVKSYGITILVTVLGTMVSLFVTSMLAYALSRKYFELRKALTVFILIPMLFSGGQISSYIVNTNLYHLKDTLTVLVMVGSVSIMNIIIFRTYITGSIPDSLCESAKIDGAKEFRTFIQIVFPLMKPSLAAVGFMVAVRYWNDWQDALLYIQSPNKTPLQLLLIRIEKNMEFVLQNSGISGANLAELTKNMPQDSGRMAIMLTVIGPIMIAYPFFQKYFVKGITMGAVKG